LALGQAPAATPGHVAARLAAGMGDLNPGHRAVALDEARDAGERLDMRIAPDPHIAGRDAAIAGDGGRLDHDESRAARCAAAEMHEMPVIGEAFLRGILAHGRHGDPIAQRHLAQSERAEEIDFTGLEVLGRLHLHVVHGEFLWIMGVETGASGRTWRRRLESAMTEVKMTRGGAGWPSATSAEFNRAYRAFSSRRTRSRRGTSSRRCQPAASAARSACAASASPPGCRSASCRARIHKAGRAI